jgi:hypothetical protein
VSSRGGEDAGDEPYDRGLAGAVVAEQAEHLALLDVEGDAVDRVDEAVLGAALGIERAVHVAELDYSHFFALK